MAIDIFNYDGTKLTTVADGTVDQTSASISFVGRGFKGWGSYVENNILWVMQNFAGQNQPSNPVIGQLWYDTNDDANILKLWNGVEWVASGGVISQPTQPAEGSNPGSFWYDTINMQLRTWNGTKWDLVGPLGSATNADPRDPAIPANSSIDAMTVKATEDGSVHQVWRITIGGTVLAIMSKDQAFTPNSTTLVNNGFPKIYPGINFNRTLQNVGLANASIIQSTLPNIDNAWNLGSPSYRMANVYSYGATVSNLTAASTTLNNNNSSTQPPLRFVPQGNLLLSPTLGAVEFNGNNFFFTNLINGTPTRQSPIFEQDLTTSNRLYVSTHGDDTNDGTTPAKSLRTIKAAMAKAEAGFTVFVEGGDYYEQNPIFVPAKVSLVGDNLRRTIVRPVHNQLDIFHVDVGTYFYGMTFKGHRAPAFSFSFPCSLATATLSGGSVSDVDPLWSQTGYNSLNPPDVFIEPPGNGGTQATATAVVVDGAITDVIVTNEGNETGTTPYSSLTTVTVTGGTPTTPAVLRPRIVDGYLVAIDVVNPGAGYEAPIGISIVDAGGGTGATARATIGNGVIQRYVITNAGSGYTRTPWVSVKPLIPSFITSSPYVQNCSSITGPFDTNGRQIGPEVSLPYDNAKLAIYGYSNLDPNGAGGGIRIDGEILDTGTVIRSFVADSFTQINQGGIGHLIINRGYAQFVSCFTTFSSVGYWSRSGGFANISNSVVDFGDVGLKAEGYYPVPYETGLLATDYASRVGSVTLIAGGSGYTPNSSFPITFVRGAGDTTGTGAAGTAYTNGAGEVASVVITNQGSGYTAVPTVNWSSGSPGTGVNGTVVLLQNTNVVVSSSSFTPVQPKNSSVMKIGNTFYTVISAVAYAGNKWNVDIYPAMLSGTSGSGVTFNDASNLSSGGLALEYVGSGVTYNALPVYGGVPDPSKQVVDEDTDAALTPGRVYYVTIDNTGNFKIGKYFAVNFADGSVSLNANSFNLTGLAGIGPFKRNGQAVGTSADEISDDPAMTHPVNPVYDHTTIPTQFATRQYLTQVSTDLRPNANNVYNLGSSTYKWNNLYMNGSIVTNNATANVATIGTALIGSGTVTGNFTIAGNLAVTGNSIVINSTSYSIADPTIEMGANGSNLLITDDGRDRGMIFHYYNTNAVPGESQGDNKAFLGRSDVPLQSSYGAMVYITNVAPGLSSVPNSIPVPGLPGSTTKWGNIEVGGGIFHGPVAINGALTVTGDITAFYTSDKRLKTDVTEITNALDKVDQIGGYTFNWNDAAVSRGKKTDVREAGVMAQEIEAVLPEAVRTTSDGFKHVDYDKIIPLLIEAIKDLKQEVEALKKK